MKSAIGIDIGGTNTKVVHVSAEGNILSSTAIPTPSETSTFSGEIKKALFTVLKDIPKDGVIGIGVGIAGLVDSKKGIVIGSPNIPAITGFPVKALLEKEFSLPVLVENDANAYAYGEKWVGAGKNFDNFVTLTLGTGLGGGIIYKGEPFECAVEIGHMVIEPRGRFCTCGSSGCLESYASGRAVIDRTVSALEKGSQSILKEWCGGNFYKIVPELVFKAAFEGDSLSREVFREMGQYLAIGVSNIVNIFSPEAIILGGGLIGAWDLFIEDLKEEFYRMAFKPLSAKVEILKSSLREDGGSIGAAGLVFRKIAKNAS